VELQGVEEVFDLVAVPLLGVELIDLHTELEIVDELHQLTIQEDLLPMGGEVLTEFWSELGDRQIEIVKIAIVGDETGGGLLPYAGHTGKVVRGVPP
jgi:hypothetical protein